MFGPLRSIIPIAVFLVTVVVAAVAIALLAAPDEAEEYPPGSPEGAVQRYLQAIQDRDIDAAYAMLSVAVREDFDRDDFSRQVPSGVANEQVSRVRVDEVDVQGERATVHLTVERVIGSGLDSDRLSYQHRVPLVREDGDWKIDDPFTVLADAKRHAMTG